MLYFMELIRPIGHENDFGLFMLLAIIPCTYLLIPIDKKKDVSFLRIGLLNVCALLLCTVFGLAIFTVSNTDVMDNYALEKINAYTLLVSSSIAVILTTYCNIKSLKIKTFGDKIKLSYYSIGLYAAQIIFAIVATGFLYLGIS